MNMSSPTANFTNTTTTVVTTSVTSPLSSTIGLPGPAPGAPVPGPSEANLFSGGYRMPPMYSMGMIASTVDDFNGKNVRRYLEKFEQRSKLDGWSEVETLDLLKLKCVGPAHDFLRSDPNLAGLNFKALKAKLITNFAPVSLPGEHQLNLSKCYQRHDETVTAYCTRLKILGSKVLEEDLRNSSLEEGPGLRRKCQTLMINQFKLGLRKDIMKDVGVLLLREEELTLEKAEEIAKFQETAMKMMQGRTVQALQVTCYTCGRVGHVSRECRSKHVESRTDRRPEVTREARERPTRQENGCFICQKPGHWARDCPTSKQERRNSGNEAGSNWNNREYKIENNLRSTKLVERREDRYNQERKPGNQGNKYNRGNTYNQEDRYYNPRRYDRNASYGAGGSRRTPDTYNSQGNGNRTYSPKRENTDRNSGDKPQVRWEDNRTYREEDSLATRSAHSLN